MASKSLGDLTRAELAAMAQRRRIEGWKSLKKDQLIKALAPAKTSKTSKVSAPKRISKVNPRQASAKAGSKPAKVTKSRIPGPKRTVAAARKTNAPAPVKKLMPKPAPRGTLTAKSRGKRN